MPSYKLLEHGEGGLKEEEEEQILTNNSEKSLPKIPLWIKISYVAVTYGLELNATCWAIFALHFMTSNAKMSPSSASLVAFLYRLWDAVNDPIVGSLSDNTNSEKWGRRRGWILAGLFPNVIAYWFMWTVPSNNMIFLFFYYLVIKLTADLGYTCMNVSHLALLNDMTKNYDERFQVNIMRTVASALGSFTSIGIIALVQKLIPGESAAFHVIATVNCFIVVITVLNCVYQTKPYSKVELVQKPVLSFPARLAAIFRVKAAALAVLIFVFATATVQITTALMTYFLQDVLGMSTIHVVATVATAQVGGLLTAVFLLIFGKRFEKKRLFLVGTGVWLLFYIGMLFITKERAWLVYPGAILLGFGMACSLNIPISFVTDAADFVEHQLNLKLEGTLFGILHLLLKGYVGLMILIFGNVLTAQGFDSSSKDKVVPESAKRAIQWSFCILPSLSLVGAMVCNMMIPITKSAHQEIQMKLKERKEAERNEEFDKKLLKATFVPSTPPFLTYFLVDGLDRKVFTRLLSEGRLPNIQQLIKEGLFVPQGVTAFPSMTGYAFYPLITGQDAPRSGILGLRWFNRAENFGLTVGSRNYCGKTNRFLNADLKPWPPTVYEHFSDHYSSSFQCYANRGVKSSFVHGWPLVAAKFPNFFPINLILNIPYFGKKLRYNWFTYEDFIMDKAIKDMNEKKPKVQWITFAGTDTLHHLKGTCEDYVQLVEHIDGLIGKYREASAALGTEEKRIYCFVSDHGVADVSMNVDVAEKLQASVPNLVI